MPGSSAGATARVSAAPAGADDGQLAADERPPEAVAGFLDDRPLSERRPRIGGGVPVEDLVVDWPPGLQGERVQLEPSPRPERAQRPGSGRLAGKRVLPRAVSVAHALSRPQRDRLEQPVAAEAHVRRARHPPASARRHMWVGGRGLPVPMATRADRPVTANPRRSRTATKSRPCSWCAPGRRRDPARPSPMSGASGSHLRLSYLLRRSAGLRRRSKLAMSAMVGLAVLGGDPGPVRHAVIAQLRHPIVGRRAAV